MRLVERTIPGTVFAFRFLFGIDSNQAFVGWGYLTFAVDVEKPGRSVLSADILVGHSVRCASTFKRNRIGKIPSGLPRTTFVVISTFRPQAVSAKQRLIGFALCVRPPPSV
jgi:hypothetical protein